MPVAPPTFLAPGIPILPSPGGFLTTTQKQPLPGHADCSVNEKLLSLLDGRHSPSQIAHACGLSLSALEAILHTLTQQGLIIAAAGRPTRRRLITPQPSRNSSLPPLLLVGLHEFGLRILEELLRLPQLPSRIYLWDPAPVGVADLGAYYRPADLGRPRVDVLPTLFGSSLPPRLKLLSGPVESLAPLFPRLSAVLCCQDRPSLLPERISALCRQKELPCVVTQLTATGAALGPLLHPRQDPAASGCPTCFALFQSHFDPFARACRDYLAASFPRELAFRYAGGEAWFVEVLAQLSLLALLQAPSRAQLPAPTNAQLWQFSQRPNSIQRSQLPRHLLCPHCFPNRHTTRASLRQQTMRDWRKFWLSSPAQPLPLADLHARLQTLFTPDFGPFAPPCSESAAQRRALFRFCDARGVNPHQNQLATAPRFVVYAPSASSAAPEPPLAEGLDLHDPLSAQTLALLEACERYCALRVPDPRRLVRASFAELAAPALDPRSFPLYSAAQYRRRNFPCRPFSENEAIDWLWATRIRDSSPVLVPRDLLFRDPSQPPLYLPNSNGAAAHSSFHAAVLSGIYEIVERDALLCTWFNQISFPLLPPPENPSRLYRDFQALDFSLTTVDLTNDLEIPVHLGVLRDRRNPDFFLVNPVASLSPSRLEAKLEKELLQFARPYLINPQSFHTPATRSTDPRRVRTLPDHLGFYQQHAKHRHAAFLTAGPLGQRRPGTEPADLAHELEDLLARLARRGFDVFVVDCTPPLLRELGLHVVKVLIPGLQPLSAGHGLTPLGGMRLSHFPRLLGLTLHNRRPEEFNPWPHPFW